MKVTWRLDSFYYNDSIIGEIEIDEGEDIEVAVRENVWNFLDLTWECEEMEIDVAERMSNALNEIGEASIALVLAEREACAKMVEEMIQPGVNSIAGDALTAAVKLIRNRPR